MADQVQKKRQDGGDSEGAATAEGSGGQKKLAKRGEELKEEMDSLIDEIDEVLEENAEEFVKNYVQRGGE
jgi:ubiquitin-like protein Pup